MKNNPKELNLPEDKPIKKYEPGKTDRKRLPGEHNSVKIIDKKIESIIIGSLESIEKHFGYLWGHDKSDNEATKEENVVYDKWMILRKEILDKGNKRRREITKTKEKQKTYGKAPLQMVFKKVDLTEPEDDNS